MSEIWLCPAGQHLCEKFKVCRYGKDSGAVPRHERWDCPGPLTSEAEIKHHTRDEQHNAGIDGFDVDWSP